jgi:D-3-phosphoglycerate dehydrogenase
MKWKVLITCPHLQRTIDPYREYFKERNIEIHLPKISQKYSEGELSEIIHDYDGMIAGDDEITANVLKNAKKLRVISKWGVGIDGIDVEAAKKMGITVYNTPNVFGDEVADVVMGYIILLARKLHLVDQEVRKGKWDDAQVRCISLKGKTIGIIGVGNIGRAVAERARAAGMGILGYDIYPIDESFLQRTAMKQVQIEEILKSSDFISLNCNLTSSNYHMIGKKEFQQMKERVYLINTSRGPLIDQEALITALKEGKIAGAALDVFENEPLPMDSPLRSINTCILGAHNSSNTLDAIMRVNELAISNLLKGLQ